MVQIIQPPPPKKRENLSIKEPAAVVFEVAVKSYTPQMVHICMRHSSPEYLSDKSNLQSDKQTGLSA